MLHIRRCWNWASVSSRIKARLPLSMILPGATNCTPPGDDDPNPARHAQRAALGGKGSETKKPAEAGLSFVQGFRPENGLAVRSILNEPSRHAQQFLLPSEPTSPRRHPTTG